MKHKVTVPGVFPLERGGALRDVTVEVRTWGRYRSSATLICHPLTGNADADDWWGNLFGPGNLFDPSQSFIVAMNVLGGCSGTTGPQTTSPVTGEPPGADFPEVTIRDMVRLQRHVLDQLGVQFLDLAIGGSMGGMQVLEWAVMYPDRVGAIVPIGVGATQSAWAIGYSEAQRQAISSDPAFRSGRYFSDAQPRSGLSTARAIAMCSYRSPQSFNARFGRIEQGGTFSVQSYLRYQGDKFTDRFDANSYLTLLRAMDSHDVGRCRGPLEPILRRITCRSLAVGISTDALYPVTEVRSLSAAIPQSRFAVLDSPHGHDAFLIETDALSALVRGFLAETRGLAAIDGRGAAWA